MPYIPNRDFWSKQRVLLTGHTGFKGAWLAQWLSRLGAEVVGLSLPPPSEPSLFAKLGKIEGLESRIGDIRDPATVAAAVKAARPSIVLHLAAQALVRLSYREPVETFATNVMGTANVLEALRDSPDLKAVLVITSDKVYRNDNSRRAFIESDPLGGEDPYSASKGACEIAVQTWAHSYFDAKNIPVATARAGNVIGGGDWAADRLIPDLWRALRDNVKLELRRPSATRPWQLVLEPLGGYLMYAERLARDADGLPRALNFGPHANDVMTVGAVTDVMLRAFGAPSDWTLTQAPQPPEMEHLSLNPSLADRALGWRPVLATAEALDWTARWYAAYNKGEDAKALCAAQIGDFEALSAARSAGQANG